MGSFLNGRSGVPGALSLATTLKERTARSFLPWLIASPLRSAIPRPGCSVEIIKQTACQVLGEFAGKTFLAENQGFTGKGENLAGGWFGGEDGRDVPICTFEALGGFFFAYAEAGGDDAGGAVAEFVVGGLEAGHEVAADVAEADHGAGGEDVQRDLGGGAGFEAGGAGE